MKISYLAAGVILAVSPIASATAHAEAPAWSQGDDARRGGEYRNDRNRQESRRDERERVRDERSAQQMRRGWRGYGEYDWDRRAPGTDRYDAGRYYRSSSSYRERRLSMNDRVYRGENGRYYCRRSDGTTGLIIGAAAGGLLGNTIGRGDSQVLGTLLGAAGGGLAGRAIERNGVRCR